MIHDKYGRQIEVGDEVIVRGHVEWLGSFRVEIRTLDGETCFVDASQTEKVASDLGPFLTCDMPVCSQPNAKP